MQIRLHGQRSLPAIASRSGEAGGLSDGSPPEVDKMELTRLWRFLKALLNPAQIGKK